MLNLSYYRYYYVVLVPPFILLVLSGCANSVWQLGLMWLCPRVHIDYECLANTINANGLIRLHPSEPLGFVFYH